MIEEYVDADWCVEQLKRMIMVPSPTGEEEKISELIASLLNDIGFKVEYQWVENRRKNVIGRWKFDDSSPTILVGGHIDTVRPACDWEKNPFVPIVENNRIFGLGACDMKGGIAALLTALRTLDERNRSFRGEIIFAGLVDEETFSKGARTFIDSTINADMAFLAEPHFDEIIIGSFGKVLLEIQMEGKAAHASTPESGINAIVEAAKLIACLQELPLRKDDSMGTGSQCVLKIHGGSQEYSLSVPDRCCFELNRHLIPIEDTNVVINDLYRLVEKMKLEGLVTVKAKDPYYPPYAINDDERVVRLLQQAFREERLQEAKLSYGKSVSDANLLVKGKKIPTVLFGPHGGNIHSAGEYVFQDSLITVARIYARVFEMVLS
jgi:acetylornithine deacetylase/succinyl-diaminopimelate desuccinylase family protein